MQKISAIVITKNEEERISDCLESIKWVDEIVLVDSYSSDRTVETAAKYTDKIYKREFDNFSNQKNYGLKKTTCDWIINIDADERVSIELKNEILEILEDNMSFDAFEIPIKTYFLGKPMK
ncbi:glycosyl transferase family 2 [Halanaerobium saccharolyticum]|jgi:glycosyltransferase involved in cell wall biosynthesis|uniref:Glycosyl transferase family 2 n=1 Tax=Halanaerobium saccharolyticum TaxID=43595 RepID=A0A4R6SJS0_9FIRM|nr:glycosyltransferase family 2 protein [Halanaerobium saccharolyticum]TDQ01626.1 glycosyl transferase family 2 [Halanaerobium saccharolyticum]